MTGTATESAPHPPHYTSVPDWSREPLVQPVDPLGRVHTVIEVVDGDRVATRAVVAGWLAALAGAQVRHHTCEDTSAAVAALEDDLVAARVGHRVLVAGSADACLAVREAGVRAGLADDEMGFGVVSVAPRTVWCVHCSAATVAELALDDVVACSGCTRNLLVYPHVSRRTGQHLGFMVDAEEA